MLTELKHDAVCDEGEGESVARSLLRVIDTDTKRMRCIDTRLHELLDLLSRGKVIRAQELVRSVMRQLHHGRWENN